MAAVGEQVTRGQAVGAVEHQIMQPRQFQHVGSRDAFHQRLDPDGGIQRAQPGGRHLHLRLAHVDLGVERLPLQVAQFHQVIIDERQTADTCGR